MLQLKAGEVGMLTGLGGGFVIYYSKRLPPQGIGRLREASMEPKIFLWCVYIHEAPPELQVAAARLRRSHVSIEIDKIEFGVP
jgi:hypothetical protein